ncbi:hypothetical protein HK100_000220 [Physocladia obscura]|uniref:Small ribosomal subunit protein uS10 domain-containing protein n=1 Tax=Physocladia obscura TaxID=109957 RepID=A0AAD5T0H5_9FUNG|nr:hypothetical protein HK100_000220 [Physocladia obscura]
MATPTGPYGVQTLATHGLRVLRPKPISVGPSSTLIGRMTLRGVMEDHVAFAAWYAATAAAQMEIGVAPVVAPAPAVKRWHVTRGPFVHDKSKEIFEHVTHARVIQIYNNPALGIGLLNGSGNGSLSDINPTVNAWITRVNSVLPPAISLRVDVFSHLDPSALNAEIAILQNQVDGERDSARKAQEAALGPDAVAAAAAASVNSNQNAPSSEKYVQIAKLTFEQDVRARANAFIQNALAPSVPESKSKSKPASTKLSQPAAKSKK